jgi:hypothetical protein
MAHTLRRSRSKYGRTRRQRRKQRRIRGGGIFDDIINKFKPDTPEEKCEKAKQAAEEVCSSVSAPSSEPVVEQQSGDELSPPSELVDSLVPENQLENPDSLAMSDMSPSYSEDIAATPATPALNTEMMPPPSMSEPAGMMPPPSVSEPVGMEQKSLTQQQPPPLPMQTVNFGGSRRKNKKKNKKQSHRKKMKSRKHKK